MPEQAITTVVATTPLPPDTHNNSQSTPTSESSPYEKVASESSGGIAIVGIFPLALRPANPRVNTIVYVRGEAQAAHNKPVLSTDVFTPDAPSRQASADFVVDDVNAGAEDGVVDTTDLPRTEPESILDIDDSHDHGRELARQQHGADEQTPQPSKELLAQAAWHTKLQMRKAGCIHVKQAVQGNNEVLYLSVFDSHRRITIDRRRKLL